MICNCKSRVKNEPISHFLFALFIPDKEMKGLLCRHGIQMSMFCLIRETGTESPEKRVPFWRWRQLTCPGGPGSRASSAQMWGPRQGGPGLQAVPPELGAALSPAGTLGHVLSRPPSSGRSLPFPPSWVKPRSGEGHLCLAARRRQAFRSRGRASQWSMLSPEPSRPSCEGLRGWKGDEAFQLMAS